MKKFIRSFYYAGQGIRHCFRRERNFRIHIAATAIVIILASLLHCTAVEWVLLLICIGMVVSLEMVNTAIERFCNMVQTDFNPQVKIIKDVAAGAVLVSAVVAAICGMIIFIPRIISCLHLFTSK
jgi:diacylglycerol kinase